MYMVFCIYLHFIHERIRLNPIKPAIKSLISLCIIKSKQIMEQQYNSLGKSLFLYYSTRLITFAFCFALVLAYINNFFTSHTNIFPDQSSISNYNRMASLIQTSATTLAAISKTTETVLLSNNKNVVYSYCTANQSISDCKNFLFQSIQNQLFYQAYDTFTSFTCMQGTCQKVSPLQDYFWTFKIRLRFIAYIVVEYQLEDGQANKLVAPACTSSSIQSLNINATQNLQLSFTYNQLSLSQLSNYSLLKLRVTLIYNTSELVSTYDIDPTHYTISPLIITPNPAYLTYSYENKQMFGYLPVSSSFVMKTWLYNLLVVLVCFVCTLPLHYLAKSFISNWEQHIFKYISTLDNLYRYQINSIFEGNKPKKSVILSQTELTFFFEDLSEIIDKDCEPVTNTISLAQKQVPFKFITLIDRVMIKFENFLKPLEQQRAYQFSNIKQLIRTSINQISDNVGKKLRDLFVKSRQLLITAQFFYFGYYSLLTPTPIFDSLLTTEKTPLPDAMISLFRYMNHTVNSSDIKFAFKFAFAYNHIVERQIIMKLQDNLLQKYFSVLKDLDAGDPNYATKLNLKKKLLGLEKTIQNKRHVFSVYLK